LLQVVELLARQQAASQHDAARSADCRNIDAPLLSKFDARHRLVGAFVT